MKHVHEMTLVVCLSAGCAFSMMDEQPTQLEPSNGQVVDVAHIYFNIATGEKVVTLLGDQEGVGSTSGPIWSSLVGNQCADQGFTTSFFFGVDDNSPTTMGGPHTDLATAVTVLDYGDISIDTVVDMVHIDWVVAHPDIDSDSDSIGDGVIGLGGQWVYWDADNGRDNCIRLPLISMTFLDLPGNIADEGFLSGYTADVDLAGSFSSSLTFEIGDSDGDLQGAAFGNNDIDTDSDGIGDGSSVAGPGVDRDLDGIDDADLDGDGLFDWAWTVRFFQPGTDSDGDGNPDGDPADSMHTIGVSFGAPEGEAIDNGNGTWTWEIDTAPIDAGTGQEDRFAMYGPLNVFGEVLYAGGFFFGGFSCEDDGTGTYTPSAMFEHQLIGPTGIVCLSCCSMDVNGDGSLNFFDISEFLSLFSGEDPVADFNGDGSFNFFDISAFLAAFSAGCP